MLEKLDISGSVYVVARLRLHEYLTSEEGRSFSLTQQQFHGPMPACITEEEKNKNQDYIPVLKFLCCGPLVGGFKRL